MRYYKGKRLKIYHDFIVHDEIVMKIKAGKSLTKVDEAQIINSLITSYYQLGLPINFGETSLRFKRSIN